MLDNDSNISLGAPFGTWKILRKENSKEIRGKVEGKRI